LPLPVRSAFADPLKRMRIKIIIFSLSNSAG
jgi:hypothetical protein